MQLIQRNICSLCILIAVILTTFFIGISYFKYKDIHKEYTIENENFVKLIANSTQNYFEQIEILLDVLGDRLLENENYKNETNIRELFNKMLKVDQKVAIYALSSPEGKVLVSNLKKSVEKSIDLIKIEETSQSFLKTLEAKTMTIGRTYFLPSTKKLVIPFRKAFFDKDNNPVAVISMAIYAQDSNIFENKILKHNSQIVNLIRDTDGYRQLYVQQDKKNNLNNIYYTKIPKENFEYASKKLVQINNKPIEKIKKEELIGTFKSVNSINNNDYLISIQYLNKYNLWISSYVKYDEIKTILIQSILSYFLVYIGIMLTIWIFFRHMNKIEEKQKRFLEHKATHDALTNLPNIFYLESITPEWLNKERFSLIYIDLDNFKYINDNFNHRFGNEVLRNIIKKIEESMKEGDLLIRQNGDEFIVLSNETVNVDAYCEKIIRNVGQSIKVREKQIKVTCSIGLSFFPKDGHSIDELINCSDIACFDAKKSKNTFTIFTQDLKNEHIENIQIEKELKSALGNKEFYLVYQPQVNSDNSLHGVETLIRWQNKNLGIVRPDKFIPIAENLGIMPQIGEFIIDTSLKQIKELQVKSSREFQLSINISITQFMEKNFYEKIIKKVEFYKIDPRLITLEITESIFIHNLDYIVSLLKKLKDFGFVISLDDFGTGYSSLSMLRQIPIDELKIDKSFIDDISTDKSAQEMAKTIIGIGKILNYDMVLAEGVETKEQLQILNGFDCNTYQGYYYSKPLKPLELQEFINKKKEQGV